MCILILAAADCGLAHTAVGLRASFMGGISESNTWGIWVKTVPKVFGIGPLPRFLASCVAISVFNPIFN